MTSNPESLLAAQADVVVVADTGPEAITGSTRLKAGTAAKLILHTFSTALTVRLGHTYGHFMIDMQETNAKLRGRSIGMLVQATGETEERCAEAMDRCGDRKTALVHLLTSADPDRCRAALVDTGGRVREAVAVLG